MKAFTKTVFLLGVLSLTAPAVQAQPSADEAATQKRIDDQEQRIRALEATLSEWKKRDQADPSGTRLVAGYDKGFFIRSSDPSSPFKLRINGRMQFRYTGVVQEDGSFNNLGTAASGTPIDLKARNDFEIERGRLEFRATGFDPKLHFYMNIDADTDDNHELRFQDFWVNYNFSNAFKLYIGKAFVPGSREWLLGSTSSFLSDRSMATTFFRPDRTIGVWAIGEPAEGFHYRAMVGNGFQTSDLELDEINDDLAGSGSLWIEPNGPFGSGYADLRAEDTLRTRFGTCFTFSRQQGQDSSGSSLAESAFLRLDDGTRLTDLGVDEFDMSLLSLDAAMKFAGFNLAGEGYYRWVDKIGPNGAPPAGFPKGSNTAYGGFVAMGYMLVPEKLDVQFRYSMVRGDFQDSSEYAGGVNYYVNGTHGNKITLDATALDGSPTDNSGPGFEIGQEGVMIRLQVQLSF